MDSYGHPIFALSTGHGRSALHVTRLSGNNVFELLAPFLRAVRHKQPLFAAKPDTAKPVTRYAFVLDEAGEVIDDVVVTFFSGPFSYTGEDTFEISSHGNPLISARLHSLLRFVGAKDAAAGEFTQRAFLNGKLDLAQAEAVAQLIDSQTEGGVRLARQVSEGRLGQVTDELGNLFTKAQAYLEAHIDFGAEDVGEIDHATVTPQLDELELKLAALLDSFVTGKKIQEGLRVAIVGKPNAGKSSLYNALLNENRAIVTDIAGTTRDVISERLVIEKRDFVLLDTAGLRATSDKVESLGIARTFEAARNADIVVTLVDGSRFQTLEALLQDAEEDQKEVDKQGDTPKQHILAIGKKDLHTSQLSTELATHARCPTSVWNDVVVTSHTDSSDLKHALVKCYDAGVSSAASPLSAILISQRQRDRVAESLRLLQEAQLLCQQKAYPENIASTLHASRVALCEILGDVNLDEILGTIFSSFCIGK